MMIEPFDAECRELFIDILARTHDMTIATNRPDGYPQATVVSFTHDGATIYFGCGADSQKAKNIALDARISITITPPYKDWHSIQGLSMAGRAAEVIDEAEKARAGELMVTRFPQALEITGDFDPTEVKMFRIYPEVISFLDYEKGFGFTDLRVFDTTEALRGRTAAVVD